MNEVVFVSDASSREAHQNLFHFADDAYMLIRDDLLGLLGGYPHNVQRVHFALTWPDMVRLAVWKNLPHNGDLFILFKTFGIPQDELQPFRNSDINDVFPWLYYGKRHDTLKKICHRARTNAGRYMPHKPVHIHCHLVAPGSTHIVASSL